MTIGNSRDGDMGAERLRVATPALEMTRKGIVAGASKEGERELPRVRVDTPALQMIGKRGPALGTRVTKELSGGSVAITTPALEMTGQRPASLPIRHTQEMTPAMGKEPPKR